MARFTQDQIMEMSVSGIVGQVEVFYWQPVIKYQLELDWGRQFYKEG